MPILIIGSLIAAIGLKYFLIPNHLLDGGVVGLSIIAAHLSGWPFGIFLVLLNIPFIYLGYKKLGTKFALNSSFGITVLAILTYIIHPETPVTTEPILAAVFGGIVVGVGVGLVIRYGSTIDGADTIAILIDKRTTFSVGEAIMFMNIFILSASGFVFGWDNAMYSLIAYFIAHKAIDVAVEGFNESRSVWIVSKKYKKIGQTITDEIGRKVTYVNGQNDEDIVSDGIILSIITRFEEQKLKTIIHTIDPKAFIMIGNAHEIIDKHSEPQFLPE